MQSDAVGAELGLEAQACGIGLREPSAHRPAGQVQCWGHMLILQDRRHDGSVT